MDRGSSKHGPKRDDELKKEVEESLTRSGRPTRTQEWRDAEPPAAEESGTPGPGEETPGR
ncbi:hypothetical protein [Streptomyces sp. ISL-11]|uniref:hypothetical protein n=1 Tax=Streptomyces sp. ISL-11 TaxID=2819174 RepID=UPI001BE88EAA|nr:hypothetical protein [Streptomyces sp. ISL-11]MBT2386593.1 hypothetical protein [Streptomyces sp. ISL-11]